MLLISIDTSGRNGSVALCRGDGQSFETLQMATLEGGTYSARLMPVIAELLEQNGFGKSDVDGFVVVSGPGSFTGLRVGLSTVKGLCEALGKPLVTVSMLEAIAMAYGSGEVSAILDAGRGEGYVGEYRVENDMATLEREFIVKLVEFPARPAARLRHLIKALQMFCAPAEWKCRWSIQFMPTASPGSGCENCWQENRRMRLRST